MQVADAEVRFAGSHVRIVPAFFMFVCGLVLLALACSAVANDYTLLSTSQTGDVYPMTIYGLYPVPGTSPVHGAPGAAGADFTQVYRSAGALRNGESAYTPKSPQFKEQWNRPSGYPPIMNWLFVPITYLSYFQALVVHVVSQLLLFLAVARWALWKLRLTRHFAWMALSVICLYLLTPIGVTHLERGQFDFMPAMTYVLSFLCLFLIRERYWLAVVIGLLGATKWTAIPFLGCFCVLAFLFGSGRSRVAFVFIPLIAGLATFAFWDGLKEYWVTIHTYELDTDPYGLTLQNFVPRIWCKAAPALLTLTVILSMWACRKDCRVRRQLLVSVSAPFSVALLCLSICFGTVSYEYHTVSLLGLLPCLVIWVEKVTWLPSWTKATMCILFGAFLAISFRVFGVTNLWGPIGMTVAYLVCAFVMLLIAMYIVTFMNCLAKPGLEA